MLLLTSLLVLPGCCFIGCEEEVLYSPAARIAVTDGSGPLEGATVMVQRYEEHPHFQPKENWSTVTNTAGEAAFETLRGTVTQYPLMMHGVGAFAWQVCAEAKGRQTRVVKLLSQGNDVGNLTWAVIDGGSPVELTVELREGKSDSCEDAVQVEAR